MKLPVQLLLLTAFGAGLASADVPVKPSVGTYSRLWTSSPFTSKPVVVVETGTDKTFEDWVLGGVSQLDGGYMVTIINKKKQGESQILLPDQVQLVYPDHIDIAKPGEKGNFSVVKVDYGTSSWMDSTVTLALGGKTGSIGFDDTMVVPKAGAVAAPNPTPVPGAVPPAPGTPNQPAPAQPQNGGHVPRPRTGNPAVPAPSPANGHR